MLLIFNFICYYKLVAVPLLYQVTLEILCVDALEINIKNRWICRTIWKVPNQEGISIFFRFHRVRDNEVGLLVVNVICISIYYS